MTLSRWAYPAIAGALAAAPVAGCGGGGGAATPALTESSIGRAEFLRGANEICRAARPRLRRAVFAYQRAHLNEPSVRVVPNAARKAIRPALRAQIDEIRSLEAPPGEAPRIEALLAALLRGVDEIVAAKPTTFAEAEAMLRRAAAGAHRYGLRECEYEIVNARARAGNRIEPER
jgi:hypothetical protein